MPPYPRVLYALSAVAVAAIALPIGFAVAADQANADRGVAPSVGQGPEIDTSVSALHFRTIRPDEVDSPE